MRNKDMKAKVEALSKVSGSSPKTTLSSKIAKLVQIVMYFLSIHAILHPLRKKRPVASQIAIKPSHLVAALSGGSILSDRDIKLLLKSGELGIDPFDEASLNTSSIDLKLGTKLKYYTNQSIKIDSDLPTSQVIDITNSSYILRPGDFVLGTTIEYVRIPDGYLGVIETRGNIARAGIQVHNNDGHIDAGFSGQITLEIKNLNSEDVKIELSSNISICQLFISKLSSNCDSLYTGKYLNQTEPTTYCP